MIYLYNNEKIYYTKVVSSGGLVYENSTTIAPPFDKYPQSVYDYKWREQGNCWEIVEKQKGGIMDRALRNRQVLSTQTEAKSIENGKNIEVFDKEGNLIHTDTKRADITYSLSKKAKESKNKIKKARIAKN